ncbi:hypothetical protein P7C70_g7841, partial [Phenoliferia sp. Uapishka_3]
MQTYRLLNEPDKTKRRKRSNEGDDVGVAKSWNVTVGPSHKFDGVEVLKCRESVEQSEIEYALLLDSRFISHLHLPKRYLQVSQASHRFKELVGRVTLALLQPVPHPRLPGEVHDTFCEGQKIIRRESNTVVPTRREVKRAKLPLGRGCEPREEWCDDSYSATNLKRPISTKMNMDCA